MLETRVYQCGYLPYFSASSACNHIRSSQFQLFQFPNHPKDHYVSEILSVTGPDTILCRLSTGIIDGTNHDLRQIAQNDPNPDQIILTTTCLVSSDAKTLFLLNSKTACFSTKVQTKYGCKSAASSETMQSIMINDQGDGFLFQSPLHLTECFSNQSSDILDSRRLRTENVDDIQLPKFTYASGGYNHFVLLAEPRSSGNDDPVWVLGDSRFGQTPHRISLEIERCIGYVDQHLQDGTAKTRKAQHLLPFRFFNRSEGFPEKVVQVAAGGRHTLIRTESGNVYGWGWNGNQQLGIENDDHENNLIQHPKLIQVSETTESEISHVACGNEQSFLVSKSGDLWVAGQDTNMLGLSQQDDQSLWHHPNLRSYSQIKPPFPCTNGFIRHPDFGIGAKFGKAIKVDVLAECTLVTTLGNLVAPVEQEEAVTPVEKENNQEADETE